MTDVLKIWKLRKLNLMGRVLVVNTLVESLFVYKMSCLELLPDEMYLAFHNVIIEYIWKGTKPRLKLPVLQAPKYQGGLRLVNLKYKHFSLLIQWIKTVENDPFLEYCMYEALIPQIGKFIWSVNLHPTDRVQDYK